MLVCQPRPVEAEIRDREMLESERDWNLAKERECVSLVEFSWSSVRSA